MNNKLINILCSKKCYNYYFQHPNRNQTLLKDSEIFFDFLKGINYNTSEINLIFEQYSSIIIFFKNKYKLSIYHAWSKYSGEKTDINIGLL